MKSYYSCIDASFVTPASLQHLCIREMAQKVGGKVVFYGSEEAKTLRSQGFMRSKLARLTDVDGVFFFSFHQFRNGDAIDWDLMKQILSKGLEIHFAREKLSFLNLSDLAQHFTFLYSVDYTLRSEQSQKWLSKIS